MIEKLESFGSFAYTLKALEKLESETRSEIQSLGGNPYLSHILDFLKNV